MFFNKNKSDAKKIDITLRNFLSFLLYQKEEFLNKLSKEYSIEERSSFLYNCAINTIFEYMQTHNTYLLPRLSSLNMQKLFKENFLLRMFQEESYDENQISSSTKEIIQEFKHIKKNLNSKEKNELLDKVNEIVTSAT